MPTNPTGETPFNVCKECNPDSARICHAIRQCVNTMNNARYVVKEYGPIHWVILDRLTDELYRHGRKSHRKALWKTRNKAEAEEHASLLNKYIDKRDRGEMSTSMYIRDLRNKQRAIIAKKRIVVTGFVKCETCGKRVKGGCKTCA